jgi:ribosomal protein S18 acetylase RimI-like enzyme
VVAIRPIDAGEGALFREIRLRALADAPGAFERTLAEEELKPQAEWDESARLASAQGELAIYIAEDGGRTLGMAGGFLDRRREGTAMLWGMWVDPDARRTGLGARLAAEVERWARSRGCSCLALWVAANNVAALSLYERLGFESAGEEKPLASSPAILERRLVKRL